MKQINRQPISAKQYIIGGLAVLGLMIGGTKLAAAERIGVIVDTRIVGNNMEVLVRVDRRPYDHIIVIPSANNANTIGGRV